jgi:hypothetical protein
MKHTESDTGDKCHREVDGVSGKAMKKAFDNKRHWSVFQTCDGECFRPVSAEDVENWKE